jgi:hypothetical protein
VIRLKGGGEEEDLVLREKDAWVRGVALSGDAKYAIAVGQSGLVQWWPLRAEHVLEEIRKISPYAAVLNSPVNQTRLREEIGDDLFNSISNIEGDSRNFGELWMSLQKKYLN